jgi:hypothetical protein
MEGCEKRPWWSVRVSGVLRIFLIALGGLVAIVLVAAVVWFVSTTWTTPRERRAAIAALDSIDELKHTGINEEIGYQSGL